MNVSEDSSGRLDSALTHSSSWANLSLEEHSSWGRSKQDGSSSSSSSQQPAAFSSLTGNHRITSNNISHGILKLATLLKRVQCQQHVLLLLNAPSPRKTSTILHETRPACANDPYYY